MRSKDKKHQIQNDYDQTAENYDARYEQGQDQKLRLLFQRLKSPRGLILDDGAGTGLLWNYLIKTNNAAQIQSVTKHSNEYSIDPPPNPFLSQDEDPTESSENESNITWGDLANFFKVGGQLEIANDDSDEDEEADNKAELAAFIGKKGGQINQTIRPKSESDLETPNQLPLHPPWNIIALVYFPRDVTNSP